MDIPIEIPFYQDWKFWSFIISGVAVLLSQLPPVRILVKPKRLDVEVHNRVNITHKVGNPNFGMHVSLGNSGGRNLRIRELKLKIQKDGEDTNSIASTKLF